MPGYSLAVQTDGKIVALGGASRDSSGFERQQFSLARLTSTGAIDFSRTDLIGSCSICGSSASTASTLIQPDGRIVSLGTFQDSHQGSFFFSLALIRHLPDGTPDGSFGSSGVVFTRWGSGSALALQPDGKLVVAGAIGSQVNSFVPPPAHGVIRLTANGPADTAFGTSGSVTSDLGPGYDSANAVAVRSDGAIVVGGSASNGPNSDLTVAVYSATGQLEASALHDVSVGGNDAASSIVLQADGRIVVGGSAGANGAVLRLAAPSALDAAFANGGKFILPGAPIRAIALQPDAKIVAAASNGDVIRLDTAGNLDATFGTGGRISTGIGGVLSLALQPDGRILLGTASVVARIDPNGAQALNASPAVVQFAPQSLNTTTGPQQVVLTNSSGSGLTINSISATSGFAATHDCQVLAAGASCTATITNTPNAVGPVGGDLVVTGSMGTLKLFLRGAGERSLTTHYYRSILLRDPDAGGKAFWDGEAARVAGLGANVNETWFAMAQAFYSSSEYAALGRGNTGFATDLYNTFFNRAPDAGGLAHWVGQLDAGLPREVLLAAFMFSAEFAGFTQAIFGNTAARAEVDMVIDFYRGLLGRTPDSAGFQYWVGRFRAAQCRNADAVTSEVEAISSAFANSSEYIIRSRTNAQFVGDLYNAFLRRGGDLAGVQFWINQLDTGGLPRDAVRLHFKNSAEFTARVNAVLAQGCVQ